MNPAERLTARHNHVYRLLCRYKDVPFTPYIIEQIRRAIVQEQGEIGWIELLHREMTRQRDSLDACWRLP